MEARKSQLSPQRQDVDSDAYGPWAWLCLVTRATLITATLMVKAITFIPPSRRKGLSWHQSVGYEALRSYQEGLDASGFQHVLPSTATTCRQYAQKYGLPHERIRLEDSDKTSATWLGPSDASKVVVVFHGGGYAAPILPTDLDMAFGFSDMKNSPPQGVAVVVLEYALASEKRNQYPRQLCQTATLVQHLIDSGRASPLSMILLGDSAGGHLLLGFLLHSRNRNPAVKTLNLNGEKFAGIVLTSPWVELSPSNPYEPPVAAMRDVITSRSLTYWGSNLLKGKQLDSWNSPLSAPIEWWNDLPVDHLLVIYGGQELFRDDVAKLADILETAQPCANLKVARFEGEVHVHMLMNRLLMVNKPCESEKVFLKWYQERLASP
ncbi:Alpha/Beta hydrolase protein [Podospora australis]|uniref:Alpha/Beta hydrolase protein n=1 Tax=Podospora australis TaxID=1536484 RepID=A0AAN6WNY4_9PEZI|nr:Alpha/Beta hydrolase protein [Podospora australis]